MNVYMDKSFSPKNELTGAEFDKYVQTSDQNTEEESADVEEES